MIASLLLLVSLSPGNALPPAAVFATRYGDAVVEVAFDVDGPGPKKVQRSQGFFVSSSGLLCTVLDGADVGDVVEVYAEGGSITGAVVADDRSGLVLVQASLTSTTPVTAPVSALGVSRDGVHSRWLIGLSRGPKGTSAVLGGDDDTPHTLMLPVPRGAPVLNDAGEVVGVVRYQKNGGRSVVLDVAVMTTLAQTLPPRTTVSDDG